MLRNYSDIMLGEKNRKNNCTELISALRKIYFKQILQENTTKS